MDTSIDTSSYIKLLKNCSPEDDSINVFTEGYFIWKKKKCGKKPDPIPEGTTKLVCPDILLKPGDIPNTVTHLIFDNKFNQRLQEGIIPNSVTHLIFGEQFNQGLHPGDIPSSVIHLEFGYQFNQGLIPGDIPHGVISLFFGHNFYQEIKEGVIPDSVLFLFLGYCNFLEGNLEMKFPEKLLEVVLYNSFERFLEKFKNNLIFGFFDQEDEKIIYPKHDITISLDSYFKLKMEYKMSI
jgi:hypothetical protein